MEIQTRNLINTNVRGNIIEKFFFERVPVKFVDAKVLQSVFGGLVIYLFGN